MGGVTFGATYEIEAGEAIALGDAREIRDAIESGWDVDVEWVEVIDVVQRGLVWVIVVQDAAGAVGTLTQARDVLVAYASGSDAFM